MTSFAEVRFPPEISYGATAGPEFSTTVITVRSGAEQRNRNWAAARLRFDASTGIKTRAQAEAIIAFFRARGGRAQGFRFKDWSDYRASAQVLGTGDGARDTFQLIKRYVSGAEEDIRLITKPVAGTTKISLNGTPQPSGWSVDTATGLVTFTSAPANGAVISADFEFDV
ncbi:MAG: DUF2460 domain-containing protein, partial [Defluviicoccus sp.]